MKKVLPLFYKLTKIKGIKSYKLKDGITNINYKVVTNQGDYVIRIPRNGMVGINYYNQAKVLKKVKELNVDVIYYDENTGILITKFISHTKRKEVPFLEVIKQIKKLHSLDCDSIEPFDPFNMIKQYKKVVTNVAFEKENKIIEKAQVLYKKYIQVLSHNDLLYSNFLKTNDNEYLIDYEYAGKNIPLFDIVSFLSENNIENVEKQNEFISLYFDNVNQDLINDLQDMNVFQDLLWAYWAYMMYSLYNEQIFLEIALLKHKRYNSIICSY